MVLAARQGRKTRELCARRAAQAPMMVFSQLFSNPFVRSSFLGLAVVATVATSQPAAWSLSDTTKPEHLALAAGAATERTVAYEASEASVQLQIQLETFATTGGKVRVVAEGCGLDRLR